MVFGSLSLYFFVFLSLLFFVFSFSVANKYVKVNSVRKKGKVSGKRESLRSVRSLRKKVSRVKIKRKSSGSHSWEKELK